MYVISTNIYCDIAIRQNKVVDTFILLYTETIKKLLKENMPKEDAVKAKVVVNIYRNEGNPGQAQIQLTNLTNILA